MVDRYTERERDTATVQSNAVRLCLVRRERTQFEPIWTSSPDIFKVEWDGAHDRCTAMYTTV